MNAGKEAAAAAKLQQAEPTAENWRSIVRRRLI